MAATQTNNPKDSEIDTKRDVVVEAKPFPGNPDGPQSIGQYLRGKGTIYNVIVANGIVSLRNQSGYQWNSDILAKRTADGNEVEPELTDDVTSKLDALLARIKSGAAADGRQV